MIKKMLQLSLSFLAILGISMILSGNVVKAEIEFAEVKPAKATSRGDCESAINSNEDASAGGSISIVMQDSKILDSTSAYFKFVLPEDAIVFLRYSMVESEEGRYLSAGVILYGDKNLVDVKQQQVEVGDTTSEARYITLKKGTYYIEASARSESFHTADTSTNRVGLAVAYIPLKGNTTDFEMVLSQTKTTTDDIVVSVETADPDAKVWAMKGAVSNSLKGNSVTWGVEYECSDKSFTVTENGVYTVQIKDSFGNYNMKTITISNIDNEKPTTPVLKSYKLNATSINGTADAGTMVYVKIGKTEKTVIARDDNTFTLKVSKLTKGTKITVYAKDNAGNKSNSKTFTVK